MFWHRFYGIIIMWRMMTTLIYAQSNGPEQLQIPIGAFRVFPKTSFSCQERPAGYYADIETGCQVYHMCDGLGRQFSYSCPNTTLFQQRMLICDHWYMVNCSRAESDYAANLLIGQRDKPFVGEDENHLRTPRPDLLDRPYAPDYSGESFRNQYKQYPSIQNQITDDFNDKYNKPSSTRWHIPRPSSEILPPPSKPIVVNRRMDDTEDFTSSDLGTSFSSNYNTSADISAEKTRVTEKPTDSNIIIPTIKVPSKLYEPPFLYPIWNENHTAEAENANDISSSVPTTSTLSPKTTTTNVPVTITRTTPPSTIPLFTRPSTIVGRPFSTTFTTTPPPTPATASITTTTTFVPNIRDTNPSTVIPEVTSFSTSTPRTFQSTRTSPLTTVAPVGNAKPDDLGLNIPNENQLLQPAPFSSHSNSADNENSELLPSKLLLPPYPEFVTHDIATTQGPPIYYEWKIPSNSLEPPKLDPPIGVNGRKEDDPPSSNDNDSLSTATSFLDSTASNQPRPFSHNPFLAPLANKSQRSVTKSLHVPGSKTTQRQVSSTQINSVTNPTKVKDSNETSSSESSTEANIDQLRKDLHIPDYLFPLESDLRVGYEPGSETVNSFQVKIPERRETGGSSTKRWYGENSECPECHPSFVKPGTCEPCVRRR